MSDGKSFRISCFPAAFLSGLEPSHRLPGVCEHLRMPAMFSYSFPPLHLSMTQLLLCDVVAQTVKVNHNGLYKYRKEKKNPKLVLKSLY